MTMAQALGICSSEGYPLATSTWRKKVLTARRLRSRTGAARHRCGTPTNVGATLSHESDVEGAVSDGYGAGAAPRGFHRRPG